MLHMTIKFALLVTLLGLGQGAYAFRMVAAGCVPDSASKSKIRTGGHGVFMRGSGTATLFCPVEIHGSFRTLKVHYNDPDRTGSNYEVKASFHYAAPGSTIGRRICSLSSNGNNSSGYTSSSCNASSHNYRSANWYWVRIDLYRNSGHNRDIEVLSVSLQ